LKDIKNYRHMADVVCNVGLLCESFRPPGRAEGTWTCRVPEHSRRITNSNVGKKVWFGESTKDRVHRTPSESGEPFIDMNIVDIVQVGDPQKAENGVDEFWRESGTRGYAD
jgi:hypothetical protein